MPWKTLFAFWASSGLGNGGPMQFESHANFQIDGFSLRPELRQRESHLLVPKHWPSGLVGD